MLYDYQDEGIGEDDKETVTVNEGQGNFPAISFIVYL